MPDNASKMRPTNSTNNFEASDFVGHSKAIDQVTHDPGTVVNFAYKALKEELIKFQITRQELSSKFNQRKHLYETQVSSSNPRAECSPFPKTFQANYSADTGILAFCENPRQICIKDAKSSFGGFCADPFSSFDGVMSENMLIDRQRRLTACHYQNGTAGGTKCAGGRACDGLTELFIANSIGCGSCNGYGACQYISGKYPSSSTSLILCIKVRLPKPPCKLCCSRI